MDSQDKVGEIVANNYKAASIFRKYGIDFCCGGGKSLSEVCKNKNINKEEIIAQLKELENVDSGEDDYNHWKLEQLIDYVVDNHHAYTRSAISDLRQYLNKVSKVHGAHNPEVVEIWDVFQRLANELESHMQKEEAILFPYIKQLERIKLSNEKAATPSFGTVKNPIGMMEHEHDVAGEFMREIRTLSANFVPPEYACNTYMVSYKLLEDFEKDLHKHIHLENNIIFPKSIELENLLK